MIGTDNIAGGIHSNSTKFDCAQPEFSSEKLILFIWIKICINRTVILRVDYYLNTDYLRQIIQRILNL